MGLQFLHPNWLWGLSLISIPIIIHLFNFRRYKTIFFNNVHLLKNVKKDSQSKNKIKELLILLVRILIITFLVLAFAQPIWSKSEKHGKQEELVDLVLIIDNSFSMSSENRNGIRFEIAKQKGLEIISAYPATTRIMLLSSDLSTKQLVYKTKEEIYTSLSNLKISAFNLSLNQVIKTAETRAKDKPQHIYIISDFQKTNIIPAKLSENNNRLFLVAIESQKQKNILIDTAYFYSPIHNLQEEEILVYKITNTSQENIIDYKTELFINDSLKAISSVDIPSEGSVSDTFFFKNKNYGTQKANISISDFPIVYDNTLFLSYYIKTKIRVGVLSDKAENIFLDAFFKNNDYFDLIYLKNNNIDNKSWSGLDVLIFNTDNQISSGILQEIKTHINQSKLLIAFTNKSNNNQELWQFLNISLTELDSSSVKLAEFNKESKLYKNSFSKIEKQIELPVIKNYRSIKNIKEWLIKSQNNKVVAALQNNNNKNTLIFTVPLTEDNRSFYTHPIIIPLLYNYMSASKNASSYYYSNQNNTYNIQLNDKLSDEVLHISNKKGNWIPEQYSTHIGVKLHLPKRLDAGHYSIVYLKNEINNISFNYNRKESFSNYYSYKELSKFENQHLQLINSSDLSTNTIKNQIEYNKALWYYAILTSLLLLIIEIFLIILWKK